MVLCKLQIPEGNHNLLNKAAQVVTPFYATLFVSDLVRVTLVN